MNYIDCIFCTHMDFDSRHETPCHYCKNTLKILDPAEYKCNNCGDCLCPDHEKEGPFNSKLPFGLVNANVSGGYSSYHLFDMTTYKFSLCEKCLRNLFNQFVIPPKLEDDIMGSGGTYEEDKIAYEYRLWEDAGGRHQAYLDKMCNAKKNCPNKAIYSQFDYNGFTENAFCEECKPEFFYPDDKLVPFISDNLKAFI